MSAVGRDHEERARTARIALALHDATYRFYLIWLDADILLISGDYQSRDRALADVERLRGSSALMRACMDPSGRFYFTAVTDAGEVLATSPTHEFPSARDEAQAIAARLLAGDLEVALFA